MRRGRDTGCRGNGSAGRPARTRHCATGDRAWRPQSDGQPLAALVAAPLEHQPACARRHPLAEAVGPGALALLRLAGALHAVASVAAGCRRMGPVDSRDAHAVNTLFADNSPRFATSSQDLAHSLARGPRGSAIVAAPARKCGAPAPLAVQKTLRTEPLTPAHARRRHR